MEGTKTNPVDWRSIAIDPTHQAGPTLAILKPPLVVELINETIPLEVLDANIKPVDHSIPMSDG